MKTPNHPSVPELDPQLEPAIWAVVSERLPVSVVRKVATRAKELEHASDDPVIGIGPQNQSATLGDERHQLGMGHPARKINRRRLLQGLGLGTVAAGVAFAAVGPLGIFAPKSLYGQAIENLKHGGIYCEFSFVGAEVRPPTSGFQWGTGVKHWVAKDGRLRSEDDSGTVSIHDPFGNMLLMLNPSTKTAIVSTTAPSRQRTNFFDSWIGLADDSRDAKEVGRELKNGKELIHFKVEPDDPDLLFDVWVDSASSSIVRVEFSDTRFKPRTDEQGITFIPPTKTIVSNIKTNQEFDESLFSATPPDGYSVQRGPLQ